MRFETTHPDLFCDLLETVKVVSNSDDEVYFILKDDKISIRQINGENTVMIIADIYPAFFDGFEKQNDEIITTDIDKLIKVAKGYKKYKRLLVQTAKEKSVLRLYGEKGKIKRRMDVPLFSSEYQHMIDPPEVQYDFIAKINTNILINLIKDCNLIDESDTVIEKEGELLKIYAEDETGSAYSELNLSEDIQLILKKDVRSIFKTSTLLNLINSGKPLSENVQIGLKTDYPIQIKFEFKYGFVTFYLAPIIPFEKAVEMSR